MNVRLVLYTVLFLFIALLGCSGTEKEETEDPQLDAAFLIENLDIEPHYFFEPVHLTKVIALEGSLGAKSKDLGKKRPQPQNQSEPMLRYRRPRIGLLRPETLYIYSEPDSIVSYIQYAFVVDAEDSTQHATAAQYYFEPTSGLYPYLKKQLTKEFGDPTEPEHVRYIKQKTGLLQTRLSVWKRNKMAVTLQVIESESLFVKISFYS